LRSKESSSHTIIITVDNSMNDSAIDKN
jgi:hypothetical protein